MTLIVDVSHLGHMYSHSTNNLFTNVNGRMVSTVVQSGIIKSIYRWSKGGTIPTVVCFDKSCPARKDLLIKSGVVYKEGRPSNKMLRWALDDTRRLLEQGGVSCVAMDGYEADDLVAAAVHSSRLLYPNERIEVVTGDTDLVPLCSDDVSVYLRSPKGTFAVDESRAKTKYAEITPDTYEPLLSERAMFKGLSVPYNTLFLLKLLRGDKSDNIKSPVMKMFPPKKYNALVEEFVSRGLSAEYTLESQHSVFGFLEEFIPSDYLPPLLQIWKSMCLNFPYEDRPSFRPFAFGTFSGSALSQACSEYRIRLT